MAFEATARLAVERAGNRSAAALTLICLTIVLFLACVLLAGSPMGPLLAIAALAIAVVILAQLPKECQGTILDLGVLYTLVVSLYGIYPLAVYWLNGYTFLATSDKRLFAAQPPPEEVAAVAWHYVTYLAAFAAAYFLVRGRESAQRMKL